MKKKELQGFGFNEKESTHCFIVDTALNPEKKIYFYESFNYGEGSNMELKSSLPKKVWYKIHRILANYFNDQLSKENVKKSRWKQGENPVRKLLGKEMMLLVWAIEETEDENEIEQAVINWKGLYPEERWFLYTIVNATTGTDTEENRSKAWRKAVKYGFIENPVKKKGA